MASPFNVFRSNLKPLMVGLTLLALFSFVLLPAIQMYQESAMPGGADQVVATYAGGSFDSEEIGYYQRIHNQSNRFLADVSELVVDRGGTPRVPNYGPDTQGRMSYGISSFSSPQTVVYTKLYAERATEMGLELDDTAIQIWMDQFVDGKLTANDLAALRSQSSGGTLGQSQLFQVLRTELTASLYERMLAGGISTGQSLLVSPVVAWQNFLKLNQQAKAVAFPFIVDEYLDKTGEPKDATVLALYEEGKERFPNPNSSEPGFRRPYAAKLEYVAAHLEDFISREVDKISEETLRAEYEKRLAGGDFVLPPMELTPDMEALLNSQLDAQTDAQTDGESTPEGQGPEAQGQAPEGTEEPMQPDTTGDGDVPAAETPTIDPPANDVPAGDAPAGDAPPVTEVPAEVPGGDGGAEPVEPAEDGVPLSSTSSDLFRDSLVADVRGAGLKAEILNQVRSNQVQLVATRAPQDEQPPAEQPPAEEPPAEQPPAEQPPAEQPPAEQPPAEQPPAEQPPAEQPPAEQPPAEQPPAEQPPAEQPPAEQPPAEQPPAEEPSAEQPPAEKPPAEEVPMEEDTAAGEVDVPAEAGVEDEVVAEEPPPAEPPAAAEPQSFEEVRDEIARDLARPIAIEAFESSISTANAAMKDYLTDLTISSGESGAEKPTPPQLETLAETLGLRYVQTPLQTILDVYQEPLGQARTGLQGGGEQLGESMFSPQRPVYYPFRAEYRGQDGERIAFSAWKTEAREAYIPELSDVREEVVAAAKLAEARQLAQEAALKLATEANDAPDKPLQELVGETRQTLVFDDLGPFSWMISIGYGYRPFMAPVEELDRVGQDFMKTVFSGPVGQYEVAPNDPKTVYYVVKATEVTPSAEELRMRYMQPNQRAAASSLAIDELSSIRQGENKNFEEQSGLEFNEEMLSRQ